MPLPAYVITLSLIGAFAFGLVIGWVTYGSLRRAKRNGLTDITTVIGAVGGAAVTKLFPTESGAFGAYSIGLAIGFFAYLKAATSPTGKQKANDWLGEAPITGGSTITGGAASDERAPIV